MFRKVFDTRLFAGPFLIPGGQHLPLLTLLLLLEAQALVSTAYPPQLPLRPPILLTTRNK